MTKPLTAGREVDAWCAKCKRISGHRILAMVGTQPARVECIHCHSVHNFKPRAPGDKPETAGGVVRRSPAAVTRSSLTKAEQARREKEQTWERATSGRTPNEFRKYDVKQRFVEGDILSHSKFGDGVVLRVIDAAKIEVLFRDGEAKTLAQGMA